MDRIGTLISMYNAFQKTGFYFITQSGLNYSFPTAADDMGYFFCTLILARWFNLAPIQAAQLFFYFGIVLTITLLIVPFYCMSRFYFSYIFITLCLGRLLMPLLHMNHPYIAYMLAVAPITLILCADFYKSTIFFRWAALIGGIIAGISDTIRSFSALPFFIFCLVFFLFNKKHSFRNKIIFFLILCFSYSIPYFYYEYQLHRRNLFLTRQKIALPENSKHVFWHNIYIGLGFLHNKEDIIWTDSCGAKKALEINSEAKYPSQLYEKTIRNEIFRLCKEKRYFIVTTIFAKLGVILYFFLIYFGGISILTSWFYPKPWYLELAFWSALEVSAFPGVLTLPVTPYLIGFITITVVYTLYSFLWALQRGFLQDAREFIVNFFKKVIYVVAESF